MSNAIISERIQSANVVSDCVVGFSRISITHGLC